MPLSSGCAIFRLHFWFDVQWILLFWDVDCPKSWQSNLWCIWVMITRRIVASVMRFVPFFAFFSEITSVSSLASRSLTFFYFRLGLQCQWQSEISISQIDTIKVSELSRFKKKVILYFPILHHFHAGIQIFRACSKLKSPACHFIHCIFPIWY